ncbi:hypothetical protein BH09VER1_BH09VER1_35690 [soil metagenome]
MTAKNSRFGKLAGRIVLSSVEVALAVLFLLAAGYASLGYLEWRQIRTNLLAHGEKLTLAELAPPPIPDAQNFFADPIWSLVPKGQNQVDALSSVPDANELQALKARYPDLRWKTNDHDRPSIAEAVWNHYAPKYVLDQQEAARFTLDILAPTDPLLQKIDLLLDRPSSRLLPDYSDPAFVANHSYPHDLGLAAGIVSLQARSNLVLGNHDAAFAQTLSLAKMARVGDKEPLLMPFIIRESIANMLTDRIQQGLAVRGWTDTDLAAFETALAPLDLLTQYPLVLRGERALFNTRFASFDYQLSTNDPDANAWEKLSSRFMGKALTLAILPADQALYNRLMQLAIDDADHAADRGLGQSKITDPSPDVFTHRFGEFRYHFTHAFMPPLSDWACSVAHIQDRLLQARLACALERYRLKNDKYPSELTALMPAFLPSMPADVVTLQPMCYQLDKIGNFRLWSVGWNETNDGAFPQYTPKKGDWVWGQSRS